ncbi:MAG TPA: glycosyltransferase family 4 protein [Puia sp.]|nr:glycosyltransferase family 4 protein [Puia sp.]
MRGIRTISIPNTISRQVLTVGLQYKNHRGGIGSVISTYSGYFDPFNFVSTYKPQRFKLFIFPYFLASCLKLSWILAWRRDIRIVHIHGAAKGSLLRKYMMYALSKRVFGKKVIYHSHGSELEAFYDRSGPFLKKFMKRFFDHVDQIICLSNQWELFFTRHFNVKKIAILENIVEDPEASPKTPKLKNEPLKLLFLGAIGDRKGIFDLLAVLADKKSEWQGRILLTIGGSGELKRLDDFIRENKLSSLVKFEGWVTGAKKNELLLQSDIYILPSYNEGLPISILEAMSYRLPVISTPVGGTPEVVKNNQNGFLVSAGDKAGFSNSIEWFIHNSDAIPEMGRQSAEMVEPYYASRVIPKLADIYLELLESK